MKKFLPICLIFLFVSVDSAIADSPEFQDTASEIINSLIQKPPSRTRGVKKTRSFIPSPTCRAIVVKEKVENQTVEKTVTIYPDQQTAHANLKIEFDVNSYRIRPQAYATLKELGAALTSVALIDKMFYINGHTDSDGPGSYNLDLS